MLSTFVSFIATLSQCHIIGLSVTLSVFLALFGEFWTDFASSCALPLEGCCLFDMIYEIYGVLKQYNLDDLHCMKDFR